MNLTAIGLRSHLLVVVAFVAAILTMGPPPALARPPKAPAADSTDAADDENAIPLAGAAGETDYGPFLQYSVYRPHRPARHGVAPMNPTAFAAAFVGELSAAVTPKALTGRYGEEIVPKAITLRVAKDTYVCFDAELLRYHSGWTGGFLNLATTNLGAIRGTGPAPAEGVQLYANREAPGWARPDGKGDSFADPRAAPVGPMPKDVGHYKGLYRHGQKVVLSYSVGTADVLELNGATTVGGQIAFTRTFHLGPTTSPTRVALRDEPEKAARADVAGGFVLIAGKVGTEVLAKDLPAGAAIDFEGGRVVVKVPALAAPATFKVIHVSGPRSELPKAAALLDAAGEVEDLPSLCKGGPALWKQAVTVAAGPQGEGEKSKFPAYVVDTIGLPEGNPWNCWIRPTGFDFFPDGRCALCTLNGDVWIGTGIGNGSPQVTWRRFAAGMYEPLGLKIVKDEIYVLGRDQITRLRDLDGNGEADFYENFNNDSATCPIYHAFAMDLWTDSRGNFYYVRDGNQTPLATPDQGCMWKVSADGRESQIIATGLRAANGMAIGPGDEIVCGDNQGHWIPSSKINRIRPGGFYGYVGDPRRLSKEEMDGVQQREAAKHPGGFDAPLCWIPYGWDNSSGGQAWAGEKWGPLSRRMLHTSYGKCTLFEVMEEDVDGVAQGGVVQLPLKFDSGIMRARTNPADGQLYVCGLRGWRTAAAKNGCFQRVRYTGKSATLPCELHVTRRGISITFTAPLDAESAGDAGSYSVEEFVYHWTSEYGSPEYMASDPQAKGHDEKTVRAARVSADRRTVTLEVEDLKPVQQMVIQMNLKAADGTPVRCSIASTINKVGNEAP